VISAFEDSVSGEAESGLGEADFFAATGMVCTRVVPVGVLGLLMVIGFTFLLSEGTAFTFLLSEGTAFPLSGDTSVGVEDLDLEDPCDCCLCREWDCI